MILRGGMRAIAHPWGAHGRMLVVDASEYRSAMADRLVIEGAVHTASVETALRSVPRHLFVDHVTKESAYADIAVPVKTDARGTPISSASQPTIVAAVLEQLTLRPGHRVLEIGTGTGYNTALLATIVGSGGAVVTIELEVDLASAAQTRLTALGFNHITVVNGDGANGHHPDARFDRAVVTTGAQSIAQAWEDQLDDGGRLVVPIVDEDGIGVIRTLDKADGALVERGLLPCGFLPMRTPPPLI